MKPMLAVDHDPTKLKFPVYASPKLDGLRGLVHEGRLLSRSLKSIPNLSAQDALAHSEFQGFDGELIAGSPTDPSCMQNCTSFFMARDKVGPFTFYVFDVHDSNAAYKDRFMELKTRLDDDPIFAAHIELWPQALIKNNDELLQYEAEQLALGYEGLILRKIDGIYKYGRSTVNEGLLLKVKRFSDSEAVIIGFEEQMENTNEKKTNELGRSKRSSHKAGKVGKDTLGAFVMKDIRSGIEFNCGTGMDDSFRDHVWKNRPKFLNKIGKYKSFMIGVKDAPRHPVWLGLRDPKDMS